jgi:hypothetical protein
MTAQPPAATTASAQARPKPEDAPVIRIALPSSGPYSAATAAASAQRRSASSAGGGAAAPAAAEEEEAMQETCVALSPRPPVSYSHSHTSASRGRLSPLLPLPASGSA